ncbi:hypothetical protein BJ944DRAFT_261278 [Cunninghamella echinulata]|nr:hypothetical protein BJ944DRAFT_261278 [Cunninghamella echinulata]
MFINISFLLSSVLYSFLYILYGHICKILTSSFLFLPILTFHTKNNRKNILYSYMHKHCYNKMLLHNLEAEKRENKIKT